MKALEVGKHLIVHPGVCHGKLTFKGTRVPVQTVLSRLAKGRSIKYLRTSWPEVSRAAITEAAILAAAALVEKYTKKTENRREPAHSGRSA